MLQIGPHEISFGCKNYTLSHWRQTSTLIKNQREQRREIERKKRNREKERERTSKKEKKKNGRKIVHGKKLSFISIKVKQRWRKKPATLMMLPRSIERQTQAHSMRINGFG